MANYSMGQIREINYNGLGNTVDMVPKYHEVFIGEHEYQDICYVFSESEKYFTAEESYLVTIKIPKHVSLETSIMVKLCAYSESSEITDYQMIKWLAVPVDSNINNNGTLVYVYNDGKDWIASTDEPGDNTIVYETVLFIESDFSNEEQAFSFILSPKIEADFKFNCILFEILRNEADELVPRQYSAEDFSLTMQEIKTIEFEGNPTNLGVWGHPDMLMSINGEEIRVGSSGYYELRDFEVTSFGVAENSVTFTIDYQYKKQ